MMPSRNPRVYLVTDAAPGRDLPGRAAAALGGLPPGVAAVQLRAKEMGARDLLALARALREVVRAAGQRLLVNDRLDVAIAAGADGVHLPSRGVPAADARRLLGRGAIVAASCHSVAEVRRALEGGADFATFGPVFETPSKRAYGPPVGLEALGEAARLGLPLVALGGVDAANAPSAVAAGAVGVAAIRAWMGAADVARAVRDLLAATG
jgi:thiamine-phosphate pyrophosphorylase